tara:strand:- start:2878 stop:4572 length:1695 start_codon:yes stop_codon:yes gene_type:complete
MSNPSISDKKFNTKIYKKYKNYRISANQKDFKSICYPKNFKLQIPQKFVAEFINPKTKYNGLLIFHQIGAGKTCAALNIAENFKGKKKIIIVTPASLVSNMYKEFLYGCVGNTYVNTEKIKKLNPKSKEYIELIKKTEKEINKNYKILSYNKFINLIENKKLNLTNSILIIDEVQNIISEKGYYYNTFYNAIYKAKENKVVILSGTPIFDKPNEIALTLNLLKLPKLIPVGSKFNELFLKKLDCTSTSKICDYDLKNTNKLKEFIKGHVSYYRGAPPVAFPKKKFKLVYCNMSDYQYKSYITVTDDEGFKSGQLLDMPNNFFLGSRIVSNIAFPQKKINEEGLDRLKGSYLKMGNLKTYSIKFYYILQKLKKAKGPVFIYSNFKNFGGIMSFIRVLDNNGYKNFFGNGEGQKRYAVWSSDNNRKQKDLIRNIFNQEANKDGSKLFIILGSPSIKEGVSLLRVNQVHILEPYWNMSLLSQVIGRAVRFCSHKDLPKNKRYVDIFLYIAVYKTNKNTIDNYIWSMANKKKDIINDLEKVIKESSIDCKLNYNGNVYKKKEKYQCIK